MGARRSHHKHIMPLFCWECKETDGGDEVEGLPFVPRHWWHLAQPVFLRVDGEILTILYDAIALVEILGGGRMGVGRHLGDNSFDYLGGIVSDNA
jgi:hypothetical protein